MRCFLHLATALGLALTLVSAAALPQARNATSAPADAAFEDATPTNACYLRPWPLTQRQTAIEVAYLQVVAPVSINVSSRAFLPVLVRACPGPVRKPPCTSLPVCTLPPVPTQSHSPRLSSRFTHIQFTSLHHPGAIHDRLTTRRRPRTPPALHRLAK